MFKPSFFAALGAAVALTGLAASPTAAQSLSTQESQAMQPTDRTTREVDELQQGRTRANSGSRVNRNARGAAPATPEAIMAAAQQIATAAGVACQVTEATHLGVAARRAQSYEAACATGPGYILIGSTPPQAIDCVLLAGQAEMDRARDPAAVLGSQCAIPQNLDVARVVAAYAAEAGVACTVDQGASIGKSSDDNLVYEVGCNGADGYWIEKEPTGWTQTACSIVVTKNQTCQFTTAAERAATLGARLAGAADCAVTDSRYMGANANGSFYEAKCGAGNGFVVRLNTAHAVQQVYPCEVAQRIGGGCTLTIVPPAPAAAAPAGQA